MSEEYYEFKYVYDGKVTTIRSSNVDGNIYELRDTIESFLLACTFQQATVDNILKENPLRSDEYLRDTRGIYG